VAKTTDVDGMLDSMSPTQFLEWCAKDLIEPIGHSGTHELLAQLASMLAGFLGMKEVTPWTFLHWKQKPDEKPVEHEVAAQFLGMFGAKKA